MPPVVFLTEEVSELRSKARSLNHHIISSADFPLLLRVTNQHNSATYRIAWAIALSLCWTLSIYQTWDRVVFYWSTPIRASTSTYRNHTLIYPMMTVCTMTTSGEEILRQIYANNSREELCHFQEPYNLRSYGHILNMSYMTIMNRINLSKDFFNYCELDSRTIDDYEPGEFKYWCRVAWSDSFVGSCMTLSSRFPAIHSRVNTFSMVSSPPKQECTPATLKLLIHQDTFDVLLNSLYDQDYIRLDFFPYIRESVRLSVAEFKYLNTPQKSCTDEETYQKCMKEFLRKGIEAANLSCTFSFLGPSKLNVCYDWNDLYQTHNALVRLFYKAKVPCARKCHEIIFRSCCTRKIQLTSRMYAISLEFVDNFVFVSEEYYAYSFVSLVCDVGGNVGICIGLCLISFLETLELCWRSLVAYVKQNIKMNRRAAK